VSYLLYVLPEASKYKTFAIPKRAGGTRQIAEPIDQLKLLQRRLADLLQNCSEENNKASKRSDDDDHPDHIAHGFKRKRSIVTNARRHRNKRFVFNLDLEDFFGTINFGRVRGFFLKDKNFALQPKVATILAQIACYEKALPQGSPCSPVISNLIGHVLDIHLARLAAQAGCTYTRYADDLTFSTNKQTFPEMVAKPVVGSDHVWMPGKELARLVTKSGFAINAKKTRMQYRDSRQEVTGLVVNSKVNVRREYRHTVRAMVHRLFSTGAFDFEYTTIAVSGAKTTVKTPGKPAQLHGMLGFIDGVDLFNRTNLPKGSAKSLTSKELMYRRFLLFKEFYAATSPIVVCEGKTDNVYIIHAIRSLASVYPKLATVDPGGKIAISLRRFKYSGSSTGRILGITGGSDQLKNFIRLYAAELARFKAPGKFHPVMVLIDNDDGATRIYNTIKELTGIKPTGAEPSIHVAGNLYVVPTPLLAAKKQSMIEDFFDAPTLKTLYKGMPFDPSNTFNSGTHYGKTDFAYRVIRPNADKIDFDGFKAILDRFVDVIDEHAKSHPVAVPVPTGRCSTVKDMS
jgi:RNA-directed DNA polymerase